MTWIEATCPTCGSVEMTPDDIVLAICSNHAEASYYGFTCPVCIEDIRKRAEDRVVELLIAEGVRPTRWSLPAEALEEHRGPPLSIDDVLDFRIAMEASSWFDDLAQKTT